MKEPYDLAPDDIADTSARRIIHRLFRAALANVNGVAADVDAESLHDLRVAIRRTRTALSQIKGVLPASVVDPISHEFKWLGDITGPCRDLDVFLLALNSEQRRSGIPGGVVASLEDFLREKRQREHSLVCAALQSERFQHLVENWSRFLQTGTEEETGPPLASSVIIEVASSQILKAYRRIQKRGAAIDIDSPAVLLHRLRIDGKKLRYLLEFFSELYPGTTIERFIKELKQLQDILGGFNDTEVQLALINTFVEHGTASSATLEGMNRLTQTITERQRELRSEFAERFDIFASDESRKRYKRTFKAR